MTQFYVLLYLSHPLSVRYELALVIHYNGASISQTGVAEYSFVLASDRV